MQVQEKKVFQQDVLDSISMATHLQNQQWVLLMKCLRRRSIHQLQTFKDKLEFLPKYTFVRTIGTQGNFLSIHFETRACVHSMIRSASNSL